MRIRRLHRVVRPERAGLRRSFVAACVFVLAGCAGSAHAQVPDVVDFVRDVQPILREHCWACHGPDQQMSGFRLDRRGDALRGGSQSDIGPGNADGSRLYHRLTGTAFGTRMPPAGPLTDDQIATIKRWIDQGAAWPDAASGEPADMPADPNAARLLQDIRRGDASAIDAALRANRAVASARGPKGQTPLMAAALYGDAAVVRRLLAAGADPNASNAAGATALMWAVPDAAKMTALLDAGADVDAVSGDGRTALLIASGTNGATSAVRLLLDYGASPWYPRAGGTTPLREAVRADDVDTFRLLLEYGAAPTAAAGVPAAFVRTNCYKCAEVIRAGDPLPKEPPDSQAGTTAPKYDLENSSRPTPIGVTAANDAAIRAALERSLPLLQDVGIRFLKQTGCVSCHHNSLVSIAVAAARRRGVAVNEKLAGEQTSITTAYLESWRERALQNVPIAGGSDTVSYLLFGLGADGYTGDASTDAQALLLRRRQGSDGHWSLQTLRPPIESNDIEVTAVSMRAMQLFTPRAFSADFQNAVERARTWLTSADPQNTEEHAFKLLGLSWSGAKPATIARAARDLLARQQRDGGWAQMDGMGTDAYATGEALVALRESGAASLRDPAYRRGVEFLLRTQFEDGSWFVETQSVPIQAYFDSGFPFGVNQWISAAATGWATTALALAR